MKVSHLVFLLCVLAALAAVGEGGAKAGPAAFRFERELTLPEGDPPLVSAGSGMPRTLVFSRKVPTRSGAPAIVVVRRHEVWYFDSDDLSLIHKNTYGEGDLVSVSKDGAFVAVLSTDFFDVTEETQYWLRVETWEGRPVWQKSLNLSRSGGFEPTLTGGLIVYPSSGLAFVPERPTASRPIPPPAPNGLMILGAAGEVLLEDPAYDDLALAYEGVVSEDGRYLAFAYGRLLGGRRRGDPLWLSGDRFCLALYDVAKGLKLWSRCFEHVQLGHIAVGDSAERIACFEGSLDERIPALHFNTFLAFDRKGRQTASRSLAEPGHLFAARWPLISANGRYCAFTVSHFDTFNLSKVYVLTTSDGTEQWEFTSSEAYDDLVCRAITDAGCAVVTAKREIPGGVENHLAFIDGGRVRQDIDLRSFGNGKAASMVFMPARDNSIWLLQEGTLSRYAIVGDPCAGH
jgi:outer membrane protein assembly factor BamB